MSGLDQAGGKTNPEQAEKKQTAVGEFLEDLSGRLQRVNDRAKEIEAQPEQLKANVFTELKDMQILSQVMNGLADKPKDEKVQVIFGKQGQILDVKGANAPIDIRDGGDIRQMTVLDCVTQLKKEMNAKADSALKSAKSIDQEKVNDMFAESTMVCQDLAKELGFKSKVPFVQTLGIVSSVPSAEVVFESMLSRAEATPQLQSWLQQVSEVRKMSASSDPLDKLDLQDKQKELATFEQSMLKNPELKDKFIEMKKFDDLLTKVGDHGRLVMLRHVVATASLRVAELKALGYTDQENINSTDRYGIGQPSAKELRDAFSLVNQAGRTSGEVSRSDAYARVSDLVSNSYSVHQSEQAKELVLNLEKARKLETSARPQLTAEQYLEARMKALPQGRRDALTQTVKDLPKEQKMATLQTMLDNEVIDLSKINAEVAVIQKSLIDPKVDIAKNLAEAEALYRQCAEASDKIDYAHIGAELAEEKAKLNPDQTVIDELKNVQQIGYQARVNYAKFQLDGGKTAEAELLMNRAVADTPQIAESDNSMQYLRLRVATEGQAVGTMAAIEIHRQNFNEQLNVHKNINAACTEINTARACCEQYKQSCVQQKSQLEAEQTRLRQKLEKIAAEDIDAKTKESKQKQIELGLQTLQKQIDEKQQHIDKITNFYEPRFLYDRACFHFAANDQAFANDLLHQLKGRLNQGQMAEGMNGDQIRKMHETVDGLIEATREKSWWERNWNYFAYGAAAVAGLAAGAATFYLGPGAIAAAGVTSTAVAGALLVGATVTAGFVAGGLAGSGVEYAATGKAPELNNMLRYGITGASFAIPGSQMVSAGRVGLTTTLGIAGQTGLKARVLPWVAVGVAGGTVEVTGQNAVDMTWGDRYTGKKDNFAKAASDSIKELPMAAVTRGIPMYTPGLGVVGRTFQTALNPVAFDAVYAPSYMQWQENRTRYNESQPEYWRRFGMTRF